MRRARCRWESAATVVDGVMRAMVSSRAALTGPILATATSRSNTSALEVVGTGGEDLLEADCALTQILFEFRPQSANRVRLPQRNHPALAQAGRGTRHSEANLRLLGFARRRQGGPGS